MPVQSCGRRGIRSRPRRVSSRRHRRSRIRVRGRGLGRRDVGGLLWYRPRAATSGGPLNAHEALDDLKQISVQMSPRCDRRTAGTVDGGHAGDAQPASGAPGAAGRASCGMRPSRRARPRSRRARAARGRDAGRQRLLLRDADRTIVATTRWIRRRTRVLRPEAVPAHLAQKNCSESAASARPTEAPAEGFRWRGVGSGPQLTLAVGSAAGSVILRRHRQRHTNRVDLYFDDGSMLSLSDERARGRRASCRSPTRCSRWPAPAG